MPKIKLCPMDSRGHMYASRACDEDYTTMIAQ